MGEFVGRNDSPDEFDFSIESKCFLFKIIDYKVVRISETRNGLSSVIDLDINRVNWLKDSIPKIVRGRKAGFCALCSIQRHVTHALKATGRILGPKDLVSNLWCILLIV
ncbi:unnamed protein product [Cuscuta europaea]|uniref:Uncharacterized protein n=1 Tax=Cuscuta europaea TaxID=41803 RepID=A0A9P1EB96_CUSEU|nr:unnamed protein product [Cuscuta europaea]